jgi:hypothetical protein
MYSSILNMKFSSRIASSYQKGWEVALKSYEEAARRRR